MSPPKLGGKPRKTWRLWLGVTAACLWWFGGGAAKLLAGKASAQTWGASASAVAALLLQILLMPGLVVCAAFAQGRRLTRLLLAAGLTSILVSIVVPWALPLILGAPMQFMAALLRFTFIGLFPAAACWLILGKPAMNDLRGTVGPALLGALALVCGVLAWHCPWECDDALYMPDSTYGHLARLAIRADPECRVRVAFHAPLAHETRGGRDWIRIPSAGVSLAVHNPTRAPKTAAVFVLAANFGAELSEAELRQGDAVLATTPLPGVYDRTRHSRNYQKKRSNVQVLAAAVFAPPGDTTLLLRTRPAGAHHAFVLLDAATPPGAMRELKRTVYLCDLADTRETYELSMSMTERLWPHTVDYDEKDLPGGGYTSVEPPLQHVLNALAVTLLNSPSMRSMADLFVAVLFVTYGVCCIAVRRLSGRLGWLTALTLACVFMAYTTFVRPAVEGASPDTTFLLFFMVAAFLMAAPERASRGDRWLIGAATVLATLTQYYATPLFCLAAVAHAAVFRQPKRSAGWALVSVAAGLSVMALRVAVAMATHSEAALFASLRDQNLARYFGLVLEIVLHGRWWLLPYMLANYAHLLLATFCASGFLLLLLPWLRRREAVFFALTAFLIFLFIGVPGFQRSHYVAPIIVPLVVGIAIGLESVPLRKRRLWRQSLALLLAAVGLGVCLWAARDYTGKLGPFSFWCRSGNMERSRYFLRETIDAEGRDDMDQAERCAFKSVLADPQPTPRGVAYTALADGYLHSGDLARACAAAKRAIESEPNMDHAYVVLAEAAARRGDLAEAETRLRQALDVDPQSAETALVMVKVLLARGARVQAVPYARRALRLRPEDPAVRRMAKELGLSP